MPPKEKRGAKKGIRHKQGKIAPKVVHYDRDDDDLPGEDRGDEGDEPIHSSRKPWSQHKAHGSSGD